MAALCFIEAQPDSLALFTGNCELIGLDIQARRAHMGIIIFCVLSFAACLFLIYVLVHFHQALVQLEKKSAVDSLIYVGSDEVSPVLARSSSQASAR